MAWGLSQTDAYTLAMEPMPTTRADTLEYALALARAALHDHPECFWTRAPHAPLESREDVVLVARRLRQHGSSAAWRRAREIELCL